jgi:segregation and condensation protein A
MIESRLHDISIEGFEGPLDLLLDLIEKEKVDISSVSLAQVADQYLEYLHGAEHIPSVELADFLVVASRLILIKSRRLFPSLEITEEEEEDISNLEEQLREYQRYRIAAREMRKWWIQGPLSVAREGYMSAAVSFYPPSNTDGSVLCSSFARLADQLPSLMRRKQETKLRIISLEQRIADLQHRIMKRASALFQRDIAGSTRQEIVVSFLALLHLMKRQIVYVEQKGAFRDILIRRNEDQ